MENEYKYGICKECGKPIEFYEYALTGLESWFCRTCYYLRFPRARKPPAEFLKWGSSIPGEESYEFLKEHLYTQPHRYEKSFQTVRPHIILLRCFETLAHLKEHLKTDYDKTFRKAVKTDLKELVNKYPHLFSPVMEILLFVLWDDLVERYGKEEGFAKGYWELIMWVKQQD
jgi:hypothetical protein